ncbi:LysM peptidoglycan-binding domain-containing protein [bacterium]|nr:LysM peptidoglycan-binding domain-containing protein [bacterium]MBP9808407.1 LysM peptidoglycan-binding domain-containing protein [bacterium]
MSSLEFRSSEPLDQAASQVNSGSDSIAREVQNQFSSVASVGKDAAMAAMPGTDAMAGLGAIPPGGEQAVSPLINMITKMPGHIGFFSSFFEALGAFFGTQLEALSQIGTHLAMTLGIDQSLLGNLGGNHLASALNAFKPEHFGLNLSLLPGNAPFFGQIGGIGGQLPGHLSGSFNSDLLSNKLNTSLGHGGEPFSQQAFGRNALNVSGSGNMAKLQFEGQGHLSGPGLSSSMPAAQVAGNNRLFSDSIGNGHSLNAQSMAQSLPMQTPSAGSLNVGSSTFGEPINNDLLAMGNQSDSFQSTVGSARPSVDSVKGGAENLGGLKAKSLSLDGNNGNLKADALGDAHALDHKVAAKHDALAPKADHAVKHNSGHKLDHAKAEARSHKTFDRTSHSVKTSNHPPSQNTAKAVTNNKSQVEAQQQELNPQQQFEQQQLEQQQQMQQQQQQEVAQNNQPLEQGQQAQAANSVEPRSYTIRSGDNLWNIAKDNLGDATKWGDIYKMNADVLGANPELIRPGTTIQLPGAESADIASATPGAAGQYTVQSGDTLWDIAHDQLGDATKWGDIYKANSELIGSNPGMIHPGQQLSLGTVDPSNQLASASGGVGGQNLTSATPGQLANAPVPQTNVNVDVQPTAQAPIESYGAEAGMPQDMQAQAAQAQPPQGQQIQSQTSTMSNYEAMPVQRINQLPDPASLGEKVIPAKAQPDVLIQPAHAAAPGQFESVKPAVNSTLANDMLSFLKKRR